MVHKCLDAFDLCVLTRPTRSTNLTTFQSEHASLEPMSMPFSKCRGLGTKPEISLTDLAKEIVLKALFKVLAKP